MIENSISPIPEITEFLRCRACGNSSLELVLDLGVHAVSDFYISVPENELKAPLAIMQCERCGLVQLSHSVSRERLYRDYWYHSGLNESMVAALKDIVDDAMERITYKHDKYDWTNVLDIGANDGTLLDQYPRPSRFRTIGFEPSQLWKEAVAKGHYVLENFYPRWRINWDSGKPKIITSVAMFYDINDPNEFTQAIKEDLAWDGIWINQMMDLEGMLTANAFDNICHEHVAYWRQSDFDRLVFNHHLQVTDVSYNMTNGGSTRFIVQHGQRISGAVESSMKQAFKNFARRVHQLKEQCLFFLESCYRGGKTVGGYGASTKGNTLLQYYGISSDLLPWIADRNPDKIGKITAGTHIPIISEEDMRDRRPDYLLILPWAFLDSFTAREAALREAGTRFILPLPSFRVL